MRKILIELTLKGFIKLNDRDRATVAKMNKDLSKITNLLDHMRIHVTNCPHYRSEGSKLLDLFAVALSKLKESYSEHLFEIPILSKLIESSSKLVNSYKKSHGEPQFYPNFVMCDLLEIWLGFKNREWLITEDEETYLNYAKKTLSKPIYKRATNQLFLFLTRFCERN